MEQKTAQQHPAWVFKFISEQGLQRVADVVSEIEKQTTGEVVVMIVRRSCMIRHVPYFLFFTLSFLALVMDFHIYYLPTILALLVLLPFSFMLARLKWVQRLFTHPEDRNFQVLERAEIEFHRHQMQQTAARTGVLIFLSLMERQAVVLGDKTIAAKLTPQIWENVVQTIVSGVRSGKTEAGLIDAVQLCGGLLKQHFPAVDHNPNELSDRVIVKD